MHHLYCRKRKINDQSACRMSSFFEPYMTPLMLACLTNNFTLVRFFKSIGHTIDKPHRADCNILFTDFAHLFVLTFFSNFRCVWEMPGTTKEWRIFGKFRKTFSCTAMYRFLFLAATKRFWRSITGSNDVISRNKIVHRSRNTNSGNFTIYYLNYKSRLSSSTFQDSLKNLSVQLGKFIIGLMSECSTEEQVRDILRNPVGCSKECVISLPRLRLALDLQDKEVDID